MNRVSGEKPDLSIKLPLFLGNSDITKAISSGSKSKVINKLKTTIKMNKVISTLAVTLALTSASALTIDRSYGIDWCRDNNDDECLCNKVNLQGPKVVLVNLDDHC